MTVRDADCYDVAVIGAGLVGSAIARELLGHELRVALVEARADVGDGTSKANTAILHTGFDTTPGTLESRLVRRGYEMLGAYAPSAGIPVERTGAILVAWTAEELAALPGLHEKATKNSVSAQRLIPDEIYQQLPALGPGALGGLAVPGESITCTWTVNLALAIDAVRRGADLRLGRPVTGISFPPDEPARLSTPGGELRARWVVNAAGLNADGLDEMSLGERRFTVTPRRGELLVFDKLARPLAPAIVLPVPSSLGKGVLVAPTIYGNVMLGPTAENLDDKTRTGTSETGFAFLRDRGRRIMPSLMAEEVTAGYAGLRAATESDDYLIEVDPARRYAVVGGIRSTGLSASMAIGEHVWQLLAEAGLTPSPRSDLPPPPRMPTLGEAFRRPYQDDERIAADPEYGRLVCFCERVSAGELRDALRGPIPARDLAGLRRRTRAMNGRCQGFYCGGALQSLLAEHQAGEASGRRLE